MQAPHFLRLGLDLGVFHPGTLNVSIAPMRYRVVHPRYTFRQVKWHATMPAEDFSFFDAWLGTAGGAHLKGLVYYPHPETKPEHAQPPDVLELLMPFVPGLVYGSSLILEVPPNQMRIGQAPA